MKRCIPTPKETYVGADLHKSFTQFNAQDANGKEIAKKRADNTVEEILGFLSTLPGQVKVAVEATGNSDWFCDVVRSGGYDVIKAHPKETRAKSGTREKNDRFDARMLATLLRGNLIEKRCWQPPEDVRRIRERLRHTRLQVKFATAYKNKAHSILIRLNIRSPYKDAFCKKGREHLLGLEIAPEYKTTVARCLEAIALAERHYQEDLEYCRELAMKDPMVELLTSIPGVGLYLACMIRYETGDVERFRSVDAYVNYTGLVPGKEQSGGKSREIGLTKEGSGHLRWAFVEAAQNIGRTKGRLSRFYWRHMIKHRTHGVAAVATAREMARIAFLMMKRKQGYYEPLVPEKKAS